MNSSTCCCVPKIRMTPAGALGAGSNTAASQLAILLSATAFSLSVTLSSQSSSAFFSRPVFVSPQTIDTP